VLFEEIGTDHVAGAQPAQLLFERLPRPLLSAVCDGVELVGRQLAQALVEQDMLKLMRN
jgi:hypothetical protein